MTKLGIYCACGVRLDVVTEARWVRGVVTPVKAGRLAATSQPYDLGADDRTRHGSRRHNADFRSPHQRWEWDCGGCGAHQQAREDRLQAALAAGRARLDFGVDL